MSGLAVFPAAAWADEVAGRLAERLRRQPRLRLCLPTGDTPTPVYARLAELARAGRAPLAEATIVLLDEFVGLPPTDPARCDQRLRRELLDRLDPQPATFHPILVDDLPPRAAAEAHDAICAEGIDLALLGLGTNGHVGLNEPGSDADSPTRVVELSDATRRSATLRYGAGSTPQAGVTIGLAGLLVAEEVWLLVTGRRKAEVLRRALEEPESSDCPASYLRRHRRLTVLADEPAAGAIQISRG